MPHGCGASTSLMGMTYEKWERLSEPIMTGLSFVFLAVYAWTVLAQPYGAWASVGNVTMDVIWVVFAVNYVITLILAPNKLQWFVHHIFDLLVVTLPMFRPLRLVFALSPLRALRKTSSQAFRARVIIYTVAVSVLVFFVGSLALLDAERGAPAATITTYSEALWCTWVSATSVGYGDYSPVTALGRVIAGTLMFSGIILNGIICALLSSWLIQEESIRKNREDRLTKERIAKINGHMDEISKDLKAVKKMLEREDAEKVDEAYREEDEEEEEDDDELAAQKVIGEELRDARVTDAPDPDSGYAQLASDPITHTIVSVQAVRPLARDPKADRLTGEKMPLSRHADQKHAESK